MLIGNIGMAGVIASVIATFTYDTEKTNWPMRIGVLVAGITLLFLLARSRFLSRIISKMIERALL